MKEKAGEIPPLQVDEMKLGGFGTLKDYEDIKNSGYDFAELDLPEITELSDEKFEKLRLLVEGEKYPVLTGARLFPIAVPYFFTDQYDKKKMQEYLEKCCMRAEKLGITKIILGNGKARWLPEEKSQKEEERFIQVIRTIAEIAGNYHLELIIEPLGPRYSNYINTIEEAVEFIEKTGCKNVYTMADLRHMIASGESFQNIVKYRKKIHHIHIDYPLSYPNRDYPSVRDDYDYSQFLNAIHDASYNDTLTVEADVPENWKAAYKQAVECIMKYGKFNE